MEEKIRHWGSCQVVRELGGGSRNQAVLVRRGNEFFVAKTTNRNEVAVRWVLEVQAIARRVGFAVPEYLEADNGDLVVESMTLERWLNGERARDEDREVVGGLLHEFHGRTRGHIQRPGFASSVELLHRSQGGDVDLEAMPADLVEECRLCWREVKTEAVSAVHGDPNLDNILRMPGGGFALIDWDEARVDVPLFDLAGLFSSNPGYSDIVWANARRALDAWEVAVSWIREPGYAREKAKLLLARGT